MRRPDIGLGRTLRLALRLTRGQQADQPCQPVHLTLLTCHNVGQVVNSARQMGDAFFQCLTRHPVTPPLAQFRPTG